MKYIKTYEDINPNKRLDELKKLLNHLVEMFNELGYDNERNYDDYQYVNLFWNANKQRSFNLNGEFSNSLIFLDVGMRVGYTRDNLAKFIPNYLKTINGLVLCSESPQFFTTTFQVVDNVDNIIDQISVEDFKLKMEREKYNI